ncbi:MAG TPA: helical backbone metal receptor [Longimicrobiales bacterium]|nr:helical backbone metal receptor [Longimicrobiales bacterium]
MTGAGALLMLAGVLACAGEAPSSTPFAEVMDDAGGRVRVAAAPQRVVSLVPALTRVIVALGARDRLIARTDYDRHPLLDSLPTVGQGLTPNLEWLAARRPDLVVGWADGTSRNLLARLAAVGTPVYSARVETLEDADSAVLRLGRLLGEDAAARALVRRTAARLDTVRALVAGRPRPRVLYVLGVDPPTVVGPGTFVHQIVQAAGGENIFADAASGWPRVSLEEVVARVPDVVVVAAGEAFADAGRARIARLPGWRDLPAVRGGRIVDVDADLFHRFGPDLPVAAALLGARLHPHAAARLAALAERWTAEDPWLAAAPPSHPGSR